MKIGLYFGSFNPVHNGHMSIANYFLEFTDLNKIWFVLSPQNPFKEKNTLLEDNERLELLNLALEGTQNYSAKDIEFNLPKPSFTINTLQYLKEKHADKKFVLIIGGDNLTSFNKWKDYKHILENYEIYVYPRPNSDLSQYVENYNIKIINAPLIEISTY